MSLDVSTHVGRLLGIARRIAFVADIALGQPIGIAYAVGDRGAYPRTNIYPRNRDANTDGDRPDSPPDCRAIDMERAAADQRH